MALNKRTVIPRLDQLESEYESARDELNDYLNISLENISSNEEEIRRFIRSVKECYKGFSQSSHHFALSLIKCASIEEGSKIRDFRKERENDVNELIAMANQYLKVLNISDELSHLSFNSKVSEALQRSPGRADSVYHDFMSDNVNEEFSRAHIPKTTTPLISLHENVISFSHNASLTVSSARNTHVPPSSSCNANIVSFPPRNPYVTSLPPRATHVTSLVSCYPNTIPHYAGVSQPSHSSLPYDPPRPFNPSYGLTAPSAYNVNYVVPNSTGTYPFSSSSPIITSCMSQFPPPIQSSVGNCNDLPYIIPPQQQGTMANPQPGFVIQQDSASVFIAKQQLFKKSADPFSGEPQKYNSWMNALRNKMTGLNLSAWDQLLALEAHTTKEPLKLIQRHMAIGGPDPNKTLESALKELKSEFGSSVRIANALNDQVESFVPIRNVYQTDKLKELSNLCQYIEANLTTSHELGVFNTAQGVRKLWLKLPEQLQNSWRTQCDDFRAANDDRYPPFSRFTKYLAKKTRELSDPILQRQQKTEYRRNDPVALKTEIPPPTPASEHSFSSKGPSLPLKNDSSKCPFHETALHSLETCRKFIHAPRKEKVNLLKSKGLCFLCFGKHLKTDCRANIKCNSCGDKHHTLLHFEKKNESVNLCTHVCGSNDTSKNCSKVVLVDITLHGSSAESLRCYAIIDEQSNSTFVDPKVAQHFNVTGPLHDYNIKTLTGAQTMTQGLIIHGLQVKGINERKRYTLQPAATNPFLPDCKDEVATPTTVEAHPHIRNFAKNFPPLDTKAQVLLLIGRDSGFCMLTRCYGNIPPFVHHTALGWSLVGNCCTSFSSSLKTSVALKTHFVEHFEISPSFPSSKPMLSYDSDSELFIERKDDELPGLSRDDIKFVDKVRSGISIDDGGSVVIPLPFKDVSPIMPDNHVEVYVRSKNTLGRLSKNYNKLNECLKVMGGYIEMNHVEIVPDHEQKPGRLGHAWWIPVFDVTHPKKMKVRIVFDSSAKYHNTSLNDKLIPGPDVGNRLRSVLIGFRNGCVGFSGDIQCMFHNFKLRANDRDYMRFYWYKNNDPNKGICQYRANVHIFGNCSSPSVANLGLRYVANLPPVINRVRDLVNEQFYVDDALGCADNVEDAISILQDTSDVLKRCNIRLHKICSSSHEVTEAFPESERASTNTIELDESSIQTALGLLWNTSSDQLILRSDVPNRPFTPRGILSIIHCIYDPLGISSPIILDGKIIQRMILSGNKSNFSEFWDEELSSEHKQLWDSWTHSLKLLSGLSIARSYRPLEFGILSVAELHAYGDASTDGTGYVIYLRSRDTSGNFHVSFVVANSRIVPKSAPSIPRLELCSALDLSVAIREVADKLRIPNDQIYAYTDSMITLGYLTNETKRFARFISRRVNIALKSLSSDRWFYVSSSENPADIASRRQSIETLSSSMWLRGPEHLWQGNYPQNQSVDSDLPETIPSSTTLQTIKHDASFLTTLSQRYSSLIKLTGVLKTILTWSYLFRKAKKRSDIVPDPNNLPPSLRDALKLLLLDAQSESFPPLSDLSKQEHFYLRSLSPYYDDNGLIRVGGRLTNSNLSYENKFPILLPRDHPLTKLIIEHHHAQVRHQGRSITLSALRLSGYFIPKASLTLRRIIKSCVMCRKLRAPLEHQRMADLPQDRLESVPPFTNVGIDVFGPYSISDGANTRRNSANKKCWALLLVCLNSRAVHIEPLPHLDISSMKNALRRFFCVRGTSKVIRSDRGTNLVGTKNIDESLQAAIQRESKDFNVTWILNPPKASHFGGIWERRIQSIKKILDNCLGLLGSRILLRDDFYTFLQECTCILNNTPLWEISADPNDPLPLTPSMLLNLRDDIPVDDQSYGEEDLGAYGSKRWKRVQYLSHQFWTRWRCDYLQTLQRRSKWTTPTRSLKPGDVVLMKDVAKKRYEWPIARISSVNTSSDGLVRSVDLVTSSKSPGITRKLTRPITELCLLVPN